MPTPYPERSQLIFITVRKGFISCRIDEVLLLSCVSKSMHSVQSAMLFYQFCPSRCGIVPKRVHISSNFLTI